MRSRRLWRPTERGRSPRKVEPFLSTRTCGIGPERRRRTVVGRGRRSGTHLHKKRRTRTRSCQRIRCPTGPGPHSPTRLVSKARSSTPATRRLTISHRSDADGGSSDGRRGVWFQGWCLAAAVSRDGPPPNGRRVPVPANKEDPQSPRTRTWGCGGRRDCRGAEAPGRRDWYATKFFWTSA